MKNNAGVRKGRSGRIGVMGLSYGGFLVNWLVGVTDRFAAAVSENGVTNQVTAWARSMLRPFSVPDPDRYVAATRAGRA